MIIISILIWSQTIIAPVSNNAWRSTGEVEQSTSEGDLRSNQINIYEAADMQEIL